MLLFVRGFKPLLNNREKKFEWKCTNTFYILKGRNIFAAKSRNCTFTLKMESEAVLELYKPSIANCGIWYIPFIGDGDSSSHSAWISVTSWSPGVWKEARVCQATKRMGTNFWGLIREYKSNMLNFQSFFFAHCKN